MDLKKSEGYRKFGLGGSQGGWDFCRSTRNVVLFYNLQSFKKGQIYKTWQKFGKNLQFMLKSLKHSLQIYNIFALKTGVIILSHFLIVFHT